MKFDDYIYERTDVEGFKWIRGDDATWAIIVRDFTDSIEPTIKLLQEKGIVGRSGAIQAGGHCGLYPYLFTSAFDMVFTFEPNPLNFHCLVQNCQGKNIIKMNVALGSKPGRIESVINNEQNMGMCTIRETEDKHYIPMLAIDSLGLTGIDLIEFDLEGCEYDALVGAKKTIEANKPVIIVENATKQIVKFLVKFGYIEWKKINRLDSVFVLEKDLEKLNDS
jgi:FkbM family methyltransferase